MRYIMFCLLCSIIASLCGAGESGADPALEAAKATHAKEIETIQSKAEQDTAKSKAKLDAAYQAAIKRAMAKGNLAAANALQSELQQTPQRDTDVGIERTFVVTAACNDVGILAINGVEVMQFGAPVTKTVQIPAKAAIVVKAENKGGAFGFAMTIADENGKVILSTNDPKRWSAVAPANPDEWMNAAGHRPNKAGVMAAGSSTAGDATSLWAGDRAMVCYLVPIIK